MITRRELIDKYLNFFKSKKHSIIPGASLVPENDPSVLFTTAGMHPLVPFLLGQKHPFGRRLVDVQKCVRTGDIDEVGDATHHTFFEMLGNWSLGDYWKKEAIEWSFEFLTKVLKLPLDRLAVTCFGGDKRVPELPVDKESAEIWASLGVKKERIVFLEGGVFESKKNWWGPAGQTGPCGPDSEMFYWISSAKVPKKFDPSDERWVEIWNDVFMEYEKTADGKYVSAKQKNVDTGMGLERTLAVINKLEDNYLTDSFESIIHEIEHLSGKKYKGNERVMRVIADHVKAAVFIMADGILPSNKEQGYVLRRLMRRAIINLRKLGFVGTGLINPIAEKAFEIYRDDESLLSKKDEIYDLVEKEEEKFEETFEKGMREFEKFAKSKKITGKEGFLLFQSYGFPIEVTEELAIERGIKIDREEFDSEYKKHQQLSRSTSAGMFKSGLADHSEHTTRLHTATHLLNEALRHVLGADVKQRGSNITPERLRFDFNFSRKLTEEEVRKIENLVNEKIKSKLEVIREEISYEQAIKSGAQAEFGHKYPEKVSVYTILDKSEKRGWFSKEICTGPHVRNTREVGKFKIVKEEASAAGIRRIKAVVKA